MISAATVQAIYNPDLVVKKGKRWAISTGVRTGYDDNVLTTTTDRQESIFSTVELSGVYAYPTDTTYVSIRTGALGNIFYNRPGSDFDFNNSFDFTFAHTFSPRLNLDVRDHFRYGQEPEISDNNVLVRRQGNYINNGLSAGLAYQLTRQWFVDLAFAHDLWSYDESVLASVLDRQTVGGGPSLRYRLSERTTLSANYRYFRNEYDQSPRSADDHVGSLGVSQDLTPRWNVNLNGGEEIRHEDNPSAQSTLYSPYVDFGTSYKLAEQTILSGGVRYSFQDTDVNSYFVSRSISGNVSLDWQISKEVASLSSINLIMSDLSDPLSTTSPDGNEHTWVLTQKISWQVFENLNLSLRYSYTNLDSDFALRSYHRNLISLGVNYYF